MHVPRRLHVAEYIILQVHYGLEGVGNVLVLLDVADDFCGLGALGEVDEVGAFYDRRDAVFDEGEVGEVDAYIAAGKEWVSFCSQVVVGLGKKNGGMGGWGRSRGSFTEERDAWRIGEMQGFAVSSKILGAAHEAAEGFENAHGAGVDLRPGAAEAVDGCGPEGGDDRCEGREVIHGAAFLGQHQRAKS